MSPNENEAGLRIQRRAGERDAEEYMKEVAHEEADMAETQMHRAHRQATLQARKVLDAVAERTTLRYVRDDRVEEAEVRTSLDRGTLAARLDDAIGSLGCGRPVILDFPGWDRLVDALKAVRHPVDLEPFKAEGELDCSEHGTTHAAVLAFGGLKPADLGMHPCACAPGGPGHRYRNVSNAVLIFGGWKVPPGESFDPPDGGEATLASFLKAHLVRDLTAPEEPVEEAPEKSAKDLLDAAVETWEQVQKPLRLEGEKEGD